MSHNKLADMRKRAGLTQQELADKLGVSQQTIWYYENGRRDMKSSVLITISNALGCTVSELLGIAPSDSVVAPHPVDVVGVPIVGRIAAGMPREAISQSDDCHDTPRSLIAGREKSFWLVVSGNSMNRLFPEGSLVLVDPDMEVRDGDVGVVFVNGDDATVKRVFYEGTRVRLHPESHDPEYRDIVIDGSDPDAPSFRAVGRVVSYTAPDDWRA